MSSGTYEGRAASKSKERIRVCCLPIAGKENPYQHLMMEGLRSSRRLEVMHGAEGKVFAALRTVLRHRPDVIHYDWIDRYYLRRYKFLTWIHAPIFLLELAFVRHILRCRLVWTMHNLVSHDGDRSQVELWVRRRFARFCDWIRVFDESTVDRAADLMDVDRDRFRVLPEGSFVGYYPNTVGREEARSQLELNDESLVLLYLGQIRPYKGLERLLDAYAAARKSNWVLMIAGLPLHERYADVIAHKAERMEGVRLRFEHIPDENLQVYFNAADVAVLPYTKVENSGTAVLAMGFGKPVIGPRIGVLPARLSEQHELLYDTGMLEGSLLNLADIDPVRLEELGKRNLVALCRHEWQDFAMLFVGQDSDQFDTIVEHTHAHTYGSQT